MSERKMCRHCKIAVVSRPRGLCWVCYRTPEISNLYPSTHPCGKRGAGNDNRPTCWSCGKPASRSSHLGALGWEVKDIVIEYGEVKHKTRETYCPECVANGDGAPDWDSVLTGAQRVQTFG